ncbi:heme ABC transporter permease CcmC [Ahrensia sp. R2A130]|uniref:heme ABC transporter permease CcmC n=1 Tax=Ahrensia sp. R2A130 TaxID=744979 RepID=UPI0001E0A461|nr:heme ABC transporter permease CcmC [Ahrensia sp. R2A130]EFL89643.1 heme exporter protein C [Ahrensia sp. R2A130]
MSVSTDTSTAPQRRPGLAALANPTRFLAFTKIVLPWLAAVTVIALAVGLYMSFNVPDDYQQGRTVRIMFVHVPSVWMAMAAYMTMVSGALGVLVWRHPLADVAARAAAPIGATFTFLGLATGSIWGRPMWGTWWEWDARLTSFLILLIIYLGLIALWNAIEEPARSARIAAVAILIGAINIPIIRFSVEWFTTLHQGPSVIREGGPSLAPQFLYPLLTMGFAFLLLFLMLHLWAMRNEIMRRQIRTLQRKAARSARG